MGSRPSYIPALAHLGLRGVSMGDKQRTIFVGYVRTPKYEFIAEVLRLPNVVRSNTDTCKFALISEGSRPLCGS